MALVGRRPRAWFAVLIALVAVMPRTAWGQERRIERSVRQTDPSYRLRIDPNLAVTEQWTFDGGGFASFTALSLDDEDGNSRTLLQPEVTLYARASLAGAHNFFTRARFRYREFSEGDSFDDDGDGWTEPFLERYWYDFDLKRQVEISEGEASDFNVNVRVGRQFIDWGAGLTLSENLYAAKVGVEFGKRLRLDGLAGVTPPDESVIDFDASREEFDRKTKRGFFGGMLTYSTEFGHSFYGYGLHMPDFNTDNTSPLLPGDVIDFDYEATYLGIGARGSFGSQLAYLAEFVYQIGESRSDPLVGAQESVDISAFAGRFQLDWLMRDRNRTRFQFESLFASGDSDRLTTTDTVGGSLPGTDDEAFNSLGFVNTGLAFSPTLSNLVSFRAGASTFPLSSQSGFDELQIGADVFAFMKFDDGAPIDEPTSDDRFLGAETDLYLNYRITSDVAVNARYGVFFPGDAIETTSSTRHFVSVGVTISF